MRCIFMIIFEKTQYAISIKSSLGLNGLPLLEDYIFRRMATHCVFFPRSSNTAPAFSHQEMSGSISVALSANQEAAWNLKRMSWKTQISSKFFQSILFIGWLVSCTPGLAPLLTVAMFLEQERPKVDWCDYHQIYNIRRTKSQNLNAFHLILQLSCSCTSELSTILLPTKLHLILEVWWYVHRVK